MRFILVFLISIISFPIIAHDIGSKDKDFKTDKKEQIEKNTAEDIGVQVQLKYNDNVTNISYDENVETMAHWHFAQSIPKPEKVSKKEG